MPERNAPAPSPAHRYVQLNPVLMSTVRSTLQQLAEHIEAQARPSQTVLSQMNPVLEQIARDIRQTMLASVRVSGSTMGLGAQIQDLQRGASDALMQFARAHTTAIGHLKPFDVDQFARALGADTDEEEVLATSARDAEDALMSDPKARKQIARSATRISQWSTLSVDDARALLLTMIWLLLVITPWSDGKLKLDDFTNPSVATITVMVAAIDGNKRQRKNPLQKNGPRRRRHRRKRQR